MPVTRHGRNRYVARLINKPRLGPGGDGVPSFTGQVPTEGQLDASLMQQAGGPERPSFPELQTPEVQRERPERNQGRQRTLRRLAYGSAAAAGLGALLGSPEVTQVAASLGSGFAEGVERNELQFQDAQAAYYDELAQVRAAEQRAANERALSEYEADLDAYQSDQAFQRERTADEREQEQMLERINTRAQARADAGVEEERRVRDLEDEPTYDERTARIRATRDRREEKNDLAGYTLPGVNDEIRQLQQTLEEGYTTIGDYNQRVQRDLDPAEQRRVRDRIRELRGVRARLQEEGSSSSQGGQGGQEAIPQADPRLQESVNQMQVQAGSPQMEGLANSWRQYMQQAGPQQTGQQILQRVEQGYISVQEAEQLLDALGI